MIGDPGIFLLDGSWMQHQEINGEINPKRICLFPVFIFSTG